MLEGVVPFPPEFAARYQEQGYWEGRSITKVFTDVFARFADRTALIAHAAAGGPFTNDGNPLNDGNLVISDKVKVTLDISAIKQSS